jgi:hypothetical protein
LLCVSTHRLGSRGRKHTVSRQSDPQAACCADRDPGVVQLIARYRLNRTLGETRAIACPAALVGASNFFELAIAAAISVFGFESGAAWAPSWACLIEVRLMLLIVRVVNATRRRCATSPAATFSARFR